MGNEEREFDIEIETDVWIAVRKRPDDDKGMDWAAVLCVTFHGRPRAVCIYDNAHGGPERHLIRRGEKLAGEPVPTKGRARLDLPAAIDEIKANWEGMVERWEP
jgi:hypothetical protein